MKPPLVHVVGEVAGGHAVDPGAVAVALDDDPVAVPAVVLEGILRLGLDLGEPHAPSALVVEAARRPGLLAGDLALRAVDDPGPPPVLRVRFVLPVDVAADLHAGVQPGVAPDLQLQHEVLVVPLAEERVRAALDRRADDRTVLDLVRGLAAPDRPAVERLAVEEGRPALVVGAGRRAEAGEDQEGRVQDGSRSRSHGMSPV